MGRRTRFTLGRSLSAGTSSFALAAPFALAALSALGAMAVSSPAAAIEPHRSERFVPSSNGRAAVAYEVKRLSLSQFLEHPYRFPAASAPETRNFAFDSYPGARVGASAAWFNTIPPSSIAYVPGTGIAHIVRSYAGVTFDEYHFAPITLAENASVMLVRATRTSGSGAIDAYAFFDYHLGTGAPAPGADAEKTTFDGSRGDADAFYETGPSKVAFAYASIGKSTHHAASPQSPFAALLAKQDLADSAGTGASASLANSSIGFQRSLGDIAVGASAWAGWTTAFAADADSAGAANRVAAWVNGRSPERLLADETAAWSSWTTKPPDSASASEVALALQSQVTLRMAQVTEPGQASGQIMASLAPGRWNITWVRDMAYATVALARTGHLAEAKASLAFQLGGKVGAYETYVGSPYQISVVRYFGDGTEEADSNQDGPNVEFDGFGLFLWALDEYVTASHDTASLAAWWPAISTKVGDALAHLQEPSGLIAPDSSIWEVHWNGKQRHFAYTTITAANGLCAAARLADASGDAARAASYRAAGIRARDAVLANFRAPDGTIGQSVEALTGGVGWLDAAAIEAINFGLIDARKHTARATASSLVHGLVPPSGRGFMRNDLGAWYDSQEWVFVDLRSSRALTVTGNAPVAVATLAWNVDQATENFSELSELHDRLSGDYAGESPMVGFGAGAFLLALADRNVAVVPTCGTFADEPGGPYDDDAGADGGAPIVPAPSAVVQDAGTYTAVPREGDSSGCSCRAASPAASTWSVGLGALLASAFAARRNRADRRHRSNRKNHKPDHRTGAR